MQNTRKTRVLPVQPRTPESTAKAADKKTKHKDCIHVLERNLHWCRAAKLPHGINSHPIAIARRYCFTESAASSSFPLPLPPPTPASKPPSPVDKPSHNLASSSMASPVASKTPDVLAPPSLREASPMELPDGDGDGEGEGDDTKASPSSVASSRLARAPLRLPATAAEEELPSSSAPCLFPPCARFIKGRKR